MMSVDEHSLDLAPVELSEQELAEISGGIDAVFTFTAIEGENVSFQSNSLGSSIIKSSSLSITTFQFCIPGFESMEDVLDAFAGLSRLFSQRD